MRKYSIGIIGNGRFGGLLYSTFSKSKNFNVKLFSRDEEVDGVRFFQFSEVCKTDILIPCVPISEFENSIKEISSEVNPNTLIVDVCSVKEYPVEIMKKNLPDNVDMLATHPMFGPDSTMNGKVFKDLKFIWSKVRVRDNNRVDMFLNFWDELGCVLIELSPSEHDRQAAYTHAFAFLIGKIGILMNVRKNSITTKGFEGILYNQTAVENDTGQLFEDMMRYNKFAKSMRSDFSKALNKIEADLRNN